MAKEATLQVRMDADLKESAEALYKGLGTSFAEAVRIFAKQSIIAQGMPFVIVSERRSAYGSLARYANHTLIEDEKNAFERAMVEKHENID